MKNIDWRAVLGGLALLVMIVVVVLELMNAVGFVGSLAY